MANKVFANGMELACKAGAGKTICAMPDVCFTPPENPATPPGVPIPYPNTGMASDTTEGSKNVKISDKEIMLKNNSYFKTSSGDEAGSAAKKGVITSQNKGKVYFNSWSMDVKFEGENVDRHLDLTTNNHASQPGDTPPFPFTDEMASPEVDPCTKANEIAKQEADKHRDHPYNNKGERPNKISVLISSNGETIMGRNQGGVTNELVEKALDDIPPNQFNGSCAEVSCISSALNQGIDVSGAVMATVHVRGPNSQPPSKHGHKDAACSVCNPLLKEFGIKEC
ncbi:MAG: PAAR-like domain-containing protein [Candidatus Methylumidiphilus sp.]